MLTLYSFFALSYFLTLILEKWRIRNPTRMTRMKIPNCKEKDWNLQCINLQYEKLYSLLLSISDASFSCSHYKKKLYCTCTAGHSTGLKGHQDWSQVAFPRQTWIFSYSTHSKSGCQSAGSTQSGRSISRGGVLSQSASQTSPEAEKRQTQLNRGEKL